MQLKKMELKGFKSFPAKTEIEFNKGLTAIVGPNGSGKSNITDAIRWVLGEQSVKSLRGEKMEDVIFAGSENKNKMNYCEVSLCLDNSDKTLDIDFEEVIIKRRVYRNGESEFFLNSKNCRLKDVRELLMDSGLGRDSYSIIEQGKVDEILSNDPQNRRKMFDEACGIARFRYKKTETEKNLKNTTENLERINDIFAEIENQIGPLKKQQEKAVKYLELNSRLKTLEVNSILRDIDRNEINLNTFIEEYRKVHNEYEKCISEKEGKESEIIEVSKDTEEMEQALKRVVSEINQLKDSLHKGETEVGISIEKINSAHRDIQRMNDEKIEENSKKENLLSQLQLLKEKRDSIFKELETMDSFITKLLRSCNDEQAVEDELDDKITEIDRIKDKYRDREHELLRELEVKKIKLENLEKKIEESLNTEKINMDELASITRIAESQEKEKLECKEQIENSRKELESAYERKKSLSEKINRDKKDFESLNIHIKECISKVNIYTNLENQLEGYYKGVKEVLKNKNLDGIHGACAQIIKTEGRYEKAIEAAMGGYMQNVVVDDEISAKKAIEYLRKNKLGRVTFLPVNRIKGYKNNISAFKNRKGVIGLASDIVNYSPEYENIINMIMGSTLVVDNIDNAISISKEKNMKLKLVTLDGDVINTSGSMTGGSFKTSSNLLSRHRLIEELKKEANSKTIELNKLKAVLRASLDEENSLTEKTAEYEAEISRLNRKIYELKINIESNREKVEKFAEITEKNRVENDNSRKEMDRIKTSVENIEKELEENRKVQQERNENEKQLKSALLMQKSKVSALRNQLNSKNIEKAKVEQNVNSVNSDMERISNEIESSEISILDKNREIEQLEQKIEELKNDRETLKNLCEEDKENISALIDRQSDYDRKIKELKESVSNKQNELRNIEKTVYEHKEKDFMCRSKIERAESTKLSFIDKLREKYEMSILTANEIRDDSLEIDREELALLKKEVKNLGNVNLDAIEEYEKVSERYEFYDTQKKDLEQSSEELVKLLNGLELEMRKEFLENFGKIADNYEKVYMKMFGGGKGELSLENPDDVLNSDILIMGRPPGKNMKSLNLLSGGERALTAISVLFAILISKPTPFVILDEIEAPLDDVNVYRFANFVKLLTDDTQFITVTHRRGTMEMADYIYGITMQEKGISKILSLDLSEAVNIV